MEYGTCYTMVKKIKGTYLGHYKYDVCLNDYGVPEDCLIWCEDNCKGRWGWWFDDAPESSHWNPENNVAYMSFAHKKDAVKFWFQNIRVLEENRLSR